MKRAAFIQAGCAASTVPALAAEKSVMTVEGPIPASQLGFTLSHEHVLVDFSGADTPAARYDDATVLARAVTHFQELRALGARAFVDCTPAYLGRNPRLLRALAKKSGVRVLTNTGFYGARDGAFVPAEFKTKTPAELAAIWIAEHRDGIDGTDIHPGFIKIGVNPGPLSELDAKLVRAAAITHKETGLPIHSHTGGSLEAGYGQLEILHGENVAPSAWTWVHAHAVKNPNDLKPAFESGAWISFDGLRPEPKSIERMVARIAYAKENQFLDRILLSHDAGWFDPAKPDGGPHRPYTVFATHLESAARSIGLNEDQFRALYTRNPANAFAI